MQKQKQNKKSSIKLLNLLLVLLLSFTAVMPQNLAAETTENKETIQAELNIDLRDILRNKDSISEDVVKKVPESGYLTKSKKISVEKGSSAWDVVKNYLDENNIPYDAQESQFGVYIKGVNNIHEFDAGKNSGWMYNVNGKTPNVGVSGYTLTDGDKVKLFYVVDYMNMPSLEDEEDAAELTVEIRNDAVSKEQGAAWEGAYLAEDNKSVIEYNEGDTIFSALITYAIKNDKQSGIAINGVHNLETAFITAISGVSKDTSVEGKKTIGWVITLNGEKPEKGLGTEVKAGDEISINFVVEDLSTQPSTPVEDVDYDKLPSSWPSFRGNSDNNAVRNSAANSPLLADSVEQVFAQKFADAGARFPKAPGQGIFVNNEYVFVTDKGDAGQLLAVDPHSGAILRSLELPNGMGYATTTPLYAEGRIFLPLDSGKVVSFPYSLWKDQKSFDEVPGSWLYDAGNSNLQSQTPLTYVDGKLIYAGLHFNRDRSNPAPLVALNANTGEIIWRKDYVGGFYFSGGIVSGNYLITGSDAQGILVIDVNTGELVDQHKSEVEIRSTVVRYNDEYYVVNGSGDLIKFTVSSEGKISINYTKNIGVRSVTTPVIDNDRLYLGTDNGKLMVLCTKDGSLIREVDVNKKYTQIAGSPLLVKHGEDAYIFFTANNNDGILYGFVDNAEKTENEDPTVVYQPEESVRQYTRNSVFMGEDGVVYFSLDSGYLIAIKGKQPVAEEPTPEPQPEPTPEPDQGSDNGGDVEEHTLKAETKENGLDLQATLKAKPAEDLILTVERKDAKALASDQYSFTEVFDINLITTEGKKVQPGSTLTISLRPSTDIEENTVLIHEIIENGERRLERLNYTVTEDEKGKLITFEVNHLSLFGLGKVVDKSSDGNVTPETSKPAETSKPEGTNKPDSNANVGKTGAQSSVITATALIALAIAIYKLRNKDEEQDLI
ncbi:DUF4430 domain-containing protein [Fastidiosipila sanguinis]|uniref:DUF4430 domain-containing protein n=1 Tax=Fastidiosipila sanguinis TaxID=236753 RepID=A0A2S0KPN0_9FIRM|nr:DUF4430 domain-containing protein [Fastidiosipila sanguinis]AVM42964.1 hypothetical protein C5Q98_06960 [Fastidiosipila sanguinis]